MDLNFCPKCGKPLEPDVNFCPVCGFALSSFTSNRTTPLPTSPPPNATVSAPSPTGNVNISSIQNKSESENYMKIFKTYVILNYVILIPLFIVSRICGEIASRAYSLDSGCAGIIMLIMILFFVFGIWAFIVKIQFIIATLSLKINEPIVKWVTAIGSFLGIIEIIGALYLNNKIKGL